MTYRPKPRSAWDRFWPKVDASGDCWQWLASTQNSGYGQFAKDGSMKLAHRVAYELLVGPIGEGLELDHLCRNRTCVNPDHLEQVTHEENVRRSSAGLNTGARQRAKTHCPQGHPYSGDNLLIYGGSRSCKICTRERVKAHQKRRRAMK